MAKVFIVCWNKKQGKWSREYSDSVENTQIDRYLQLGLWVKMRIVEDSDPEDFLNHDLRERIVADISRYFAEGKADSSRRDLEDDWVDTLTNGYNGYHEATDLELVTEYKDMFEHDGYSAYSKTVDEINAAIALQKILT